MKTAMQELIDICTKEKHTPHLSSETRFGLQIAIIEATKLLEKEERLMFHCFNYAADRTCDKEFNEYLNKYYSNEQ